MKLFKSLALFWSFQCHIQTFSGHTVFSCHIAIDILEKDRTTEKECVDFELGIDAPLHICIWVGADMISPLDNWILLICLTKVQN